MAERKVSRVGKVLGDIEFAAAAASPIFTRLDKVDVDPSFILELEALRALIERIGRLAYGARQDVNHG